MLCAFHIVRRIGFRETISDGVYKTFVAIAKIFCKYKTLIYNNKEKQLNFCREWCKNSRKKIFIFLKKSWRFMKHFLPLCRYTK